MLLDALSTGTTTYLSCNEDKLEATVLLFKTGVALELILYCSLDTLRLRTDLNNFTHSESELVSSSSCFAQRLA